MQECTISQGGHCSCPECMEYEEVLSLIGCDESMDAEKATQIMKQGGYDDTKIKKYLEIFDDIGFP